MHLKLSSAKCRRFSISNPIWTGLNGATPEEEAVVEMTADCIDDYIVGPVSRFHKENDPQRKVKTRVKQTPGITPSEQHFQ